MEEVYKYLYNHDDIEPDTLLKKIIKKFKLDVLEAKRIYDNWKVEYMKPKYKVKENSREGFKIISGGK